MPGRFTGQTISALTVTIAGVTNPVTGNGFIDMKSANERALGINQAAQCALLVVGHRFPWRSWSAECTTRVPQADGDTQSRGPTPPTVRSARSR